MRGWRRGVGLLCLLLLGGCGSVRSWVPWFHSSSSPPSKFDQVWQAVQTLAQEEEWPLKRVEPEAGLLQTDWMLLSSDFYQDATRTTSSDRYSECPPPTGGIYYRGKEVQLSITVYPMEKVQGKIPLYVETRFRTTVYFLGTQMPMGAVECPSTGFLETAIGQAIQSRLAS